MAENSIKQRIIELAQRFVTENALIVDTETTGLSNEDEIVEIAIIDAAGTFEFSSLIKPSRPIPQEATRIHGITNEMVKVALSPPRAWPIIRHMIVGRPLLAYNAPFDCQMMEQTFGLHDYATWDCLMDAWMAFNDLERWQRLENVCSAIGVEPGGHRALGDAKAAREVLRWLARQAKCD